MFNYSELIRVIDNIEVREAKEKAMEIADLRDKYLELARSIVESGVLADWCRLKRLCAKAKVRLCVAQQGKDSMGIVLGMNDYYYCKEYDDGGHFASELYYDTDYGFRYDADEGIITWMFLGSPKRARGFRDDEHKLNFRIQLLETFMETYEDYRKFQLSRIDEKYGTRVKAEDIVKQFIF